MATVGDAGFAGVGECVVAPDLGVLPELAAHQQYDVGSTSGAGIDVHESCQWGQCHVGSAMPGDQTMVGRSIAGTVSFFGGYGIWMIGHDYENFQ